MTSRRTVVYALACTVGAGLLLAIVFAGVPGVGPAASTAPAEATLDGEDPLELPAAPTATVEGETDLADGANVTVRVTAEDDSPFLHSATDAVEDGTFAATVDLTGAEPDQTVNVTVHHDGDRLTSRDGVIVEPANETAEREPDGPVAFDDGATDLPAAPDATVRGTAEADPGTDLTVRVRSTGEHPFLARAETTVDEDGTFAATLDLSGAESGQEAALVATLDGERVTADASIVEPADERASADAADADSGDDETTSEPAFDLSFDADPVELDAVAAATLRGSTDLDPGTEADVRLRSTGDQPFLRTNATTVDDDGEFAVTYNLTRVEAPQDAVVSVRADGESVEADAVVGEP